MKKKVYPDWTLEEYLKCNRRLDNMPDKLWTMDSDPLGAMHRWFCPQLFEQICVLDPDLEKLYKNYQGTDRQRQRIANHLKDVCFRKYLQIIAAKYTKLNDQMVDYFAELFTTGEWDKDKKEYGQYPNKGIEPTDVHKNCFIV